MSSVFLSYSREDRDRVKPLVDVLSSLGFDVWWDRDISPGESFEEEIDKRILRAGCVIVVWSRHSIDSRWVKNEALEGLERDILVPLLLDDVRIPVAFRQTQAAEFSTWPDSISEDQMLALINAINRTLDRPEQTETGVIIQSKPTKRIAAWLLGALTVIVVAGFLTYQNSAPVLDNSLAVLRFKNVSNPADLYLADTLSTELHNRLSAVEGIRVVNQFASWDQPAGLDLSEIAARLGVSMLLEGRLIVMGNSQLLQLTLSEMNGSVLLQKEYDASQPTIQLSQRMVDQVLSSIGVSVSLAVERRIQDSYTENEKAYDAYLRGMDSLRRASEPGGFVEARSFFAQAVALDSRFSRAFSGLCRANLALYEGRRSVEDFENAERACNRALTLDQSANESHLALAELYFYSGQQDVAEAQLGRILKRDAGNVEALILSGRLYISRDLFAEAEQAFSQAIAKLPGYWKSYNARGALHFQRGRYLDAIEDFTQVTFLDPDNVKAWNNLGTARYLSGEMQGAIDAWQRSHSIQASRTALSNIGTANYYLGRFDDAARMYREAIEIAPQDHRLWGNLGDTQRLNGQLEFAEASYQKAIELAEADLAINEDDIAGRSRLAVYHAAIGHVETAENYLGETAEAAVADPNILYDRVITMMLLGEQEKASDSYQMLLHSGYPESMLANEPMFEGLR